MFSSKYLFQRTPLTKNIIQGGGNNLFLFETKHDDVADKEESIRFVLRICCCCVTEYRMWWRKIKAHLFQRRLTIFRNVFKSFIWQVRRNNLRHLLWIRIFVCSLNLFFFKKKREVLKCWLMFSMKTYMHYFQERIISKIKRNAFHLNTINYRVWVSPECRRRIIKRIKYLSCWYEKVSTNPHTQLSVNNRWVIIPRVWCSVLW